MWYCYIESFNMLYILHYQKKTLKETFNVLKFEFADRMSYHFFSFYVVDDLLNIHIILLYIHVDFLFRKCSFWLITRRLLNKF